MVLFFGPKMFWVGIFEVVWQFYVKNLSVIVFQAYDVFGFVVNFVILGSCFFKKREFWKWSKEFLMLERDKIGGTIWGCLKKWSYMRVYFGFEGYFLRLQS